jgi:FMN-dependent NADH-azoreductase
MKELLYIDCTMHPGSRTALLAEAFFDALDKTKFHVTTLDLDAMDLEPLRNESFRTRQLLLTRPERDHPRFDLAKQFSAADVIVIAAPYWDMSFPSLLKVYIEQICIDGVTFATTETGLLGLCRAEQLIYLTTRGGLVETDGPLDQASAYLRALQNLLGYKNYTCIAASGLDIADYDWQSSMNEAIQCAKKTARSLAD